jgi:starch phosphorylase
MLTLTPTFPITLPSDVTNGITPRRWLDQCNPELSALITKTLGSQAWLKDLPLLKGLLKHTEDAAFRKQWSAIKQRNKERLAELIRTELGIKIPTHAAFDVQIKCVRARRSSPRPKLY